jgi:acetolactate synthase I/II/III large subunit
MKLSDYVIQRLVDAGVRHVFMVAGGGSMHLVDSIGKRNDIEYVCMLHEQGAALAADAYAQYTGLGVCLVTTGPGGTNAITGVAASWAESTPVLFISGQVKRADMRPNQTVRQFGSQEIDIITIVKSITKYAVTVMDSHTIEFNMDRVLAKAQGGRPGPVWLDIPLDVQAAEIEA